MVRIKQRHRQLENDLYSLEKMACAASLQGLMETYKVGGVDYITGSAFQPLVIRDNEDPWGMSTHSFREVEGPFKLMGDEDGTKFSGVKAGVIPSVRVIEDGDVRAVIEAMFEYGRSVICQRYKIPKQGTEIAIHTRVHWNEKDRMLKLSVPVAGNPPSSPLKGGQRGVYLGQTAFAVQELPTNGDEAVAQKWTAVVRSDGNALTCINEGTYASDFSSRPAELDSASKGDVENCLRLTLLRSPAYAAHPIGDRPMVPQDRYTVRIDQGERQFRFWINAGSAEERLKRIDREALVKNEKPFAMSFFPSGAGSKPKPFAELSDSVVQMSAAKPAEDGNGIIIRLYEPTGKPRNTTLSLPFCGLKHAVSLGPFEIKTLRIDPKNRSVTEADLMERPLR